ncbi:MAG TPA: hypothetical protein GXX26_03360 [Clostridiaceae bacterium]|nr:hypothetical protein [Clostridiaceae bacterium]
MEIYRNFTCLHGSDRHVLVRYQSEFYEFSPESITGRRSVNNDKNLYEDKSDPPGQYIIDDR